MKNNKGFSLIEVIIAVMILGIVLGIGARQIDVVFGYSAREARTDLSAVIESLRVSCLSKSKGNAGSIYSGPGTIDPQLDVYIEIYQKDNGRYYVDYIEGTNPPVTKELGPRRIDITYTYVDDTTENPVGDQTNPLRLSFKRTGGFLQQDAAPAPEKYVQYIHCKSSNKDYSLKLMPTTGKVVLE